MDHHIRRPLVGQIDIDSILIIGILIDSRKHRTVARAKKIYAKRLSHRMGG